MGDVGAILGVGRGGGGEDSAPAAASAFRARGGAGTKVVIDTPAAKKKQKIPRELLGLMTSQPSVEALPPLMPVKRMGLIGLKSRPGSSKSKRWLWKPFTSSARKDSASFSHWVRADSEFPEYPFARFNKKVDIIKYTDAEYSALLSPAADKVTDTNDHDARWPREHTDILFELCRKYDLRWPIIYDRFDLKPAHSLEEMKLRFYTVTTRILATRVKDKDELVRQSAQPCMAYNNYQYKPEWEQKRRKQLDAAFRRSNEALNQERELLKELRVVHGQIKKLQVRAERAGGAPQPSPTTVKSEAGAGVGARDADIEMAGVTVEAAQSLGASGASGEPVVLPADTLHYPPLFPNAASLSIANLAVKAHAPHVIGLSSKPPTAEETALAVAAAASGLGAARRAALAAKPASALPDKDFFHGVALRSQQVAAPLEGYAPESKSLERVAALLKEFHVPDKPLACAQVMVLHRQLRRESERLLTMGRAVEKEEEEVHKLYALRRELGLKPPQTGRVMPSSGMLAAQAMLAAASSSMQQQAQQGSGGGASGGMSASGPPPGVASQMGRGVGGGGGGGGGGAATGPGARGGMGPPPGEAGKGGGQQVTQQGGRQASAPGGTGSTSTGGGGGGVRPPGTGGGYPAQAPSGGGGGLPQGVGGGYAPQQQQAAPRGAPIAARPSGGPSGGPGASGGMGGPQPGGSAATATPRLVAPQGGGVPSAPAMAVGRVLAPSAAPGGVPGMLHPQAQPQARPGVGVGGMAVMSGPPPAPGAPSTIATAGTGGGGGGGGATTPSGAQAGRKRKASELEGGGASAAAASGKKARADA